ncbi:MAG: hypothetical protein ACI35V_08680 [Sphingobacterium composti]
MKKIPLLPRYFSWIGIILVLVSFIIYLNGIYKFLPFDSYGFWGEFYTLMNVSEVKGEEDFIFELQKVNYSLILILVPSMIGLAIIAFSKVNFVEDEFIDRIRLQSWSTSIIIFLAYSLVINMFTYGTLYFSFAVVSPHLLLLSFILIFKVKLLKLNRRLANEE